MIKKRLFCFNLIIVMTVSLFASCGKETESSDAVELVDPVGVTANYAYAERQDLISYSSYNGIIVPTVSEVSFTSDQLFSSYGVLPGSSVKKGEAVVNASTDSIDERIKALKETISDNLESHNEYIDEIREERSKEESDNAYYKEVLDRFSNNESLKDEQPNIYSRFKALYTASNAYIERYDEQLKESIELYDLDSAYDQTKLNRLYKQRKEVLAVAKNDGIVVAAQSFDINEYIQKNTSIAAVGDFNNLILRTEYVYANDVKRAKEVYAFINGKKYAAEFIPPDENEVVTSVNDAHSSFRIADPNGEIKAGDYGMLVIVSAISEEALCVPTEALNKDEDGYFVYLFDGEKTVNTPVKTGIKSGLYTEILSGLKDGDRVVSEFKIEKSGNVQELTTGSVCTGFSKNGYFFYSNAKYIKNPVEYGTVYLQELKVKQYERVEKGQTIATISVVKDDINIRRKERQILRTNEDIKSLVEDGEEKNKKILKTKREYVADLQKQVNEMKADGNVTEIKAPYDGIITQVKRFEEGDILLQDTWVAVISEEQNCFIVVEDEGGQLTCGMKTSIDYKDSEGVSRTAEGDVVTVTPWALSENLRLGFSLIRVPSEDLARMAASNQGMDGWWMRAHFTVNAETRKMDNVVLVPKRAVRTEGDISYVTVLDENNRPVLKSFIAGGSDSTNYWVIEGLSEGTKICLE